MLVPCVVRAAKPKSDAEKAIWRIHHATMVQAHLWPLSVSNRTTKCTLLLGPPIAPRLLIEKQKNWLN